MTFVEYIFVRLAKSVQFFVTVFDFEFKKSLVGLTVKFIVRNVHSSVQIGKMRERSLPIIQLDAELLKRLMEIPINSFD